MEQQIVLILIIGAISLVNWLIDKSSKQREKRRIENLEHEDQHSPPTPFPDQLPPQSNRTEESLRDFMDTFGFPTSMEPVPPPIQSSPPIFEQPLPSIPSPRPLPAPPIVVPLRSIAHRVSLGNSNHWTSLLHGRGTTRQAMILSEILGPPRAHSHH
jgi:hypothetical protein